MVKLGKVVLNGTPRMAVGFRDGVSREVVLDAERHGLDVAELRIDLFSSFEKNHVLREIEKFKSLPVIATIRSKKEGGKWSLSESERRNLFRAVIPKVNAIDIELSAKEIVKAVVETAHAAKKTVIISYHNFSRTPGKKELERIIQKAKALGADVVKIAALSHGPKDIQTLARVTPENRSRNLVTIAMGPDGMISRILFPALGSLVTYASSGRAMAPGQLGYAATFDLLRKFYPKI